MPRIFTDGSSLNNGKRGVKRYGGIGVYFGEDDERNISESLTGKVTNQIAELKACIEGIKVASQEGGIIHVYSDSRYVIKSMTEWVKNWEKNGWKNSKKKPIENMELIKELHTLTKKCHVIYHYCPAHQSEPNKEEDLDKWEIWRGNYMADKYALAAAKATANSATTK